MENVEKGKLPGQIMTTTEAIRAVDSLVFDLEDASKEIATLENHFIERTSDQDAKNLVARIKKLVEKLSTIADTVEKARQATLNQ